METRTQEKFMYMFERLSEPLYLGPRGANNVYFDIPMTTTDEKTQKTASMIREKLKQENMGPSAMIPVKMPQQMPDLSSIGKGCRRNEIFTYFMPTHKAAAVELKNILMNQATVEDFLNTAALARDSKMVNSGLFVHAAMAAALERPDMRGIKFPPLLEVMPDMFIPPGVRTIANRQVAMPMEGRSVIKINGPPVERIGTPDAVIDASFTGRNNNPENKLWYFREDVGVNSHHWHWHVVYDGDTPYEGPGSKDRRGELFYYMHHSMLARYDAERLCNGLERVKFLDLSTRPVITEGYFSKLTSETSGRMWGTRQENTQVNDVIRTVDATEFRVEVEDLRKWKDRILEAIDTGFIITRDGKRRELTLDRGIDMLGNIVQSGGALSLNQRFYGNLHNMGHVVIALANDPERRHNEDWGPMAHEATAMKDPVFYRWHKCIDDIFNRHKRNLPPYTEDELVWQDVRVSSVKVSTTTNRPDRSPNTLYTYWMESDIDLTRGLDLSRTSNMNSGPVWARITHLNHDNFSYEINVENNTARETQGTVRIFMAPTYDEHGQPLTFSQQRLLFFEMDKIFVELRPGSNRIVRRSTSSSVTIPWESSFRDLERLIKESGADGKLDPKDASCGCGWPQHMLLPRGSGGGTVFDLFVIVTDGSADRVVRAGKPPVCKESLSFCGILNDKYPDARPMGFPFDRVGRKVTEAGSSMEAEIPNLERFIIPNSNMKSIRVRIVHEAERIERRDNGAPDDMEVMGPFNAVSNNKTAPINFPDRNRPPQRTRTRDVQPDDFDYAYDSSPERFDSN